VALRRRRGCRADAWRCQCLQQQPVVRRQFHVAAGIGIGFGIGFGIGINRYRDPQLPEE
jgi:hypothetical protein